MRAKDLRREFTGFFAERGHEVVPSASLIPHDDSLLFTVAGMVPFKPYFVGEEPAPWQRATSVQKCVRAGGKHNDLDEIGRTSRHLSFFEMMGNFSFGDYFKELAIPLAWEFVTDVLGLDPHRLWVTVHLTDDEAEQIWRDVVGVPPERIQRLDEDNYWKMGDSGPCGPCSEIFWDKGADYGADGGPAFGGDERFVEIWNLVFMQFEQMPDGTRVALPTPSIDTGAGLERVLAVVQNVDSVWELDHIRSLIAAVEARSGVAYGASERSDVSQRIVAEHARTAAFLLADGVIPSNEDRGYVLRRIIRRAVRHAYLLGVEDPLLPDIVDEVVNQMGEDYPELVDHHDNISAAIRREEVGFRETMRLGLVILDEHLDRLDGGGVLDGTVAFTLHDTYGFPFEVTQEVVAERGATVDLEGFEREMTAQRERARAARKDRSVEGSATSFAAMAEQNGPTEFVGREVDECEARVIGVVGDSVVLDRTPFYAESGGQIGDTGRITGAGFSADVVDTTYGAPGVVRHHLSSVEGRAEVGMEVVARIDTDRRARIRRHHTATHILHWALRETLGDHVRQQGSWVGPDRLRFDFSHFERVSPDDITRIEDLANAEILTNAAVRHVETTKQEALAAGAIAFFGDKYGDVVRVLEAGPHSIELCGGTHVAALGDIGPLKIVSESSIGSNIRRIEAVAGTEPVERLRATERLVADVANLVGVPARRPGRRRGQAARRAEGGPRGAEVAQGPARRRVGGRSGLDRRRRHRGGTGVQRRP